jgi:hypothetical protein
MWTLLQLGGFTLEAIIKRLRHGRRGISTVIVVMLSLILIVIIVGNVVLWSYQMNQLDWERMEEKIGIINAERINRSSWFVTPNEFSVVDGSHVSGNYTDTQAVDSNYERFTEALANTLSVNGIYTIDLSGYPLPYIQNIEIQLRYRASDSGEKWYLKAYNWTKEAYSDDGFNSTAGQIPTTGWDYYTVNLTTSWRSYVWNNGTLYVQFIDQGSDSSSTIIDIDFLGVRAVIDGARFSFRNDGALTSHLVSLWIINATVHQHYDIDVFVNSGENATYTRVDLQLPADNFTVKVVTERGNTAVLASH